MLVDTLRSTYRRLWILPRIHKTYRNLSLQETFQRIYRTQAWGSQGGRFCSGGGSHGPVSDRHCAFLQQFIQARGVRSVIDLGCGDFSVGKRITETCNIRYTGIDVVPELIEHHRSTVRDPRIEFRLADITRDPLPDADLCLVRQVLQHLSNEEIAKALANLRHYPLVLISEEVPIHPRSFNRDKPHGPDVRAYYRSGVWVEQPPFQIPILHEWEIRLGENSKLRTVLLGPEVPAVKSTSASRCPS